MKQYMLAVHGDDRRRDAFARGDAEVLQAGRRVQRRAPGRRRMGVRRWAPAVRAPPPSSSATTATSITTDGPFAETKEQLGGFWIIERRRPRRRARAGREGHRRPAWNRSRSARSRTSPRPSDAIRRTSCRRRCTLERIFREESGRVVATLVRLFGDIDIAEEAVQEAFVVATERWPTTGLPPNPRRLDHHDGPQPCHRPLRREASRDDRHAQAALLHERDEPLEQVGPMNDDRLRLIFTCCHPALAHERTGRAHAAPARRARDRRDRTGVPRARGDDGAAARARQAQDPRREDPLPCARRRRAARAGFARCWP